MTAEHEARCVVSVFPTAFRDVMNINPTGTLDCEGTHATGTMQRTPRPTNVYHIEVAAEINMSYLSAAFQDGMSNYTISYFLSLPQLFYP